MTVEWFVVLVSCFWAVGLALLAANGTAFQAGLRWGLSNRDEPFQATGWVDRAHRAHRNHLENLPVLIGVVAALHATSIHTSATERGAWLFLVSRGLFSLVYISGWNPLALRTQLFFLSLGALVWMVSACWIF